MLFSYYLLGIYIISFGELYTDEVKCFPNIIMSIKVLYSVIFLQTVKDSVLYRIRFISI